MARTNELWLQQQASADFAGLLGACAVISKVAEFDYLELIWLCIIGAAVILDWTTTEASTSLHEPPR